MGKIMGVIMELEELFVEIPGFPNYLVSNYGRVLNQTYNRDLASSHSSDGHCKVILYAQGVGKTCQVHQLVAQGFFDEWVPGLEVLHIHPNYDDNSVTNLTLGDYIWR